MSTKVNPIPAGCRSVTPHTVVNGAGEAIESYVQAFGAKESYRMPGPDGTGVMHAEIAIGDSKIFLAEECPWGSSKSPATLGGTATIIHLYVPDTDAGFAQAVAAEAKVVMPPTDMFWGDRYSQVTDPFGYIWSLATHIEDLSPEEMGKRAAAAFAETASAQ